MKTVQFVVSKARTAARLNTWRGFAHGGELGFSSAISDSGQYAR
jgi:hypothetical protein